MICFLAVIVPVLLLKNQLPTSSAPTIELLTPDELARVLKISKATVYRLIEKRKIPFHKVMGSIRFDKHDVVVYLQEHRVDLVG